MSATSAIASALHMLGLGATFAFGALRLSALSRRDVDATRFADNGYGVAALLVYGAGLWRLFGELEKPIAFYSENPLFWAKIGLLAVAFALELYPQWVVLPWHVRAARGQPIEPKPGQFERMHRLVAAELACLVGVVVCASLMARGMGRPDAGRSDASASASVDGATSASPEVDVARAAQLYEQHCRVCHQTDGRGQNGRLAADLTGATLAQPDDVLLRSIREGKSGSIGLMPAWRRVLSDEEQRAVLAHLRARFGRTRPEGESSPAAPR
jgi:putative membrane protein